ncbi:hypothetical protein V3C99_017895 [Haemonchus contortus]
MLSEQVERTEMRGCEDVPMDSSRCSDVEADTDMQAEHEKHKRIIAVLNTAKSLEEFGGHQIAVPEWLARPENKKKSHRKSCSISSRRICVSRRFVE